MAKIREGREGAPSELCSLCPIDGLFSRSTLEPLQTGLGGVKAKGKKTLKKDGQ